MAPWSNDSNGRRLVHTPPAPLDEGPPESPGQHPRTQDHHNCRDCRIGRRDHLGGLAGTGAHPGRDQGCDDHRPGGPGVAEDVQLDATVYLPETHPRTGRDHGSRLRRIETIGGRGRGADGQGRVRRPGLFGSRFRRIDRPDRAGFPGLRDPGRPRRCRLAGAAARGRAGRTGRPPGRRHRRLLRRRAVADAGRHRSPDRRGCAVDHLERPRAVAVPERAGHRRRSGGGDPGRRGRRQRRRLQEVLGLQPDRVGDPGPGAVADRCRAGRQRGQRFRPPRRQRHHLGGTSADGQPDATPDASAMPPPRRRRASAAAG